MHCRQSLLSTKFQCPTTERGITAPLSVIHAHARLGRYKNEYTRHSRSPVASTSETAQVSQTETFLETLEQGTTEPIPLNESIENLRVKVCIGCSCSRDEW